MWQIFKISPVAPVSIRIRIRINHNSPSVSSGAFCRRERGKGKETSWSLSGIGNNAILFNKSMMNGSWLLSVRSGCHHLAWCQSMTGNGVLAALPLSWVGKACLLAGSEQAILPVLGSLGFSSPFLIRGFHTSWSLPLGNKPETLRNTDLYSWLLPYNYHSLMRFRFWLLLSHLSLSFIFCFET